MNRLLPLLAVTSLMLVACGGSVVPTNIAAETSADGGTCGDTWADYGQPFFANVCASCHEHTGQFGTQASVQSQLNRIKSEISSGAMPEGGGLTSGQRARILAYLNCGLTQ